MQGRSRYNPNLGPGSAQGGSASTDPIEIGRYLDPFDPTYQRSPLLRPDRRIASALRHPVSRQVEALQSDPQMTRSPSRLGHPARRIGGRTRRCGRFAGHRRAGFPGANRIIRGAAGCGRPGRPSDVPGGPSRSDSVLAHPNKLPSHPRRSTGWRRGSDPGARPAPTPSKAGVPRRSITGRRSPKPGPSRRSR